MLEADLERAEERATKSERFVLLAGASSKCAIVVVLLQQMHRTGQRTANGGQQSEVTRGKRREGKWCLHTCETSATTLFHAQAQMREELFEQQIKLLNAKLKEVSTRADACTMYTDHSVDRRKHEQNWQNDPCRSCSPRWTDWKVSAAQGVPRPLPDILTAILTPTCFAYRRAHR